MLAFDAASGGWPMNRRNHRLLKWTCAICCLLMIALWLLSGSFHVFQTDRTHYAVRIRRGA